MPPMGFCVSLLSRLQRSEWRCEFGSSERCPLLAATLLRLFKAIKQASGVSSCKCFDSMRLAFLNRVTRDGTFRAKEFCFLLHFVVPHVFVGFAHVHKHAHLGDGLKPCRAGLPHVSRKGRHGQKVLWVGRGNVESGDTAV